MKFGMSDPPLATTLSQAVNATCLRVLFERPRRRDRWEWWWECAKTWPKKINKSNEWFCVMAVPDKNLIGRPRALRRQSTGITPWMEREARINLHCKRLPAKSLGATSKLGAKCTQFPNQVKGCFFQIVVRRFCIVPRVFQKLAVAQRAGVRLFLMRGGGGPGQEGEGGKRRLDRLCDRVC